MTRVAPLIRSFNAGELSPLMGARTDQDRYLAGCERMENFIPTVQGPATRRGGTRYAGKTKSNGRAWMAPFMFSLGQSYVLEFGNVSGAGYLRFWTNRGQLMFGGNPLEVVAPWASADLVTSDGSFALRFAQSGDVQWIANNKGTYAPYKLTRLGATSWTLNAISFTDGPFKSVDPTNTTTVSASGATGSVTLTASASVFTSADVGCPFYMEVLNPSAYPVWEAGKAIASGAFYRYQGNVYQSQNAAMSGSSPPVHLYGNGTDGVSGVTWKYIHSGYGVVLITAVASGTSATGTVLTTWNTVAQPTQLPPDVTAGGANGSTSTTRWAHAAFNNTDGWPTDVKFFRGRLAYLRGNQVFLSISGAYDSFSRKDGPTTNSDSAMALYLPTERAVWLAPFTPALIFGTPSAERSISEQTPNAVLSPSNVKDDPQTGYGSKAIEPILVADALLFVPRTGKRIREFKYDSGVGKYKADDMTVLAEHIAKAGIIDMDFAQEPNAILWTVLADGTLKSFTYNRERGVIAWAKHPIGGTSDVGSGGFVEAVCCISSPDGSRDDTWLIVRRLINGNVVRYVEYIEDETLWEGSLSDAFYVDAGITYSGAAASVIGGLSHLEGQTVSVFADSSAFPDAVVSGGSITLPTAVSKAQIGLPFVSVLQPMRIEAGTEDGTAQTKQKSTALLYLRLAKTVGGKAGPSMASLDRILMNDTHAPVGVPIAPQRGDYLLHWASGFPDVNADIFVVQDQPLPMTLVGLVPRVEIND